MQLLNLLSFLFLVVPSVSLANENDQLVNSLAIWKETAYQAGYQLDKVRSERDSVINIAVGYRDRFNIDEQELENLKHVITTSNTGKVDTIFVTQLVPDTAQLRKVREVYRRENDSLKGRIKNIDSLKLSRKPVIGVRPKVQ